VTPNRGSTPRVAIEPTPPRPGRDPAQWHVAWRIQNLGPEPLQILAAWLPHGRFRAPELQLAPAPLLAPGGSAQVQALVTCNEAPATVVDNAFVILRVLWGDEPWRIFVRLRVVADERGAPQNTCELITAQRIGFSRGPLGDLGSYDARPASG
jgi:hypothetical protein